MKYYYMYLVCEGRIRDGKLLSWDGSLEELQRRFPHRVIKTLDELIQTCGDARYLMSFSQYDGVPVSAMF